MSSFAAPFLGSIVPAVVPAVVPVVVPTVVLPVAMTSMISTGLGAPVKAIVVPDSVPDVAVPTAGEVSMVSPMPTIRPMFVVAGAAMGIAMLDLIALAIQHEGEEGVAMDRGHECEEVQSVIDSLAAMAVAGFRAHREEQAREDECADCRELPDFRGRSFRRMH